MSTRKRSAGLTLVEVLVAVSIAAIVMAIAVSTYTRFLAKQSIVKAMNATSYLRQAVEDYYFNYGYFPGVYDLTTGPGAPYITGQDTSTNQPTYTNSELDIARIAYSHPTSNCNSSTSNCTTTGNSVWRQVEVTFSNPTSVASSLISNKTFIMRANLRGGVINWECATYNYAGGAVDGTLMPKQCYNSALNI